MHRLVDYMKIAMLNKSKRAQFWSFDALFAMLIFAAAVTILALTWLNVSNELALASGSQSYIMELQAQVVSQNLLSQGSPANWQSTINLTTPSTWSNIAIGLGSQKGTLSPAKIYALHSMGSYNYTDTGESLGTDFNYYITIQGSQMNVSIGENPTTNNALTTFLNKNSAFVNGVPVKLTVYIWSASESSVT